MAKENREQNCGNCTHCVSIPANRRFRCTAVPTDPSIFWNGFPEDHWCGVHWAPKKVEKPPIKVTQEK